MNKEEKQYLTVSEINNYIKMLFDNTVTLQNIVLRGEISNFTGANRSGHIYFTLKDEQSSIRAVMFKYDTFSLTFKPKDGDKVDLYGSISSYPPTGSYQIIVKKIIFTDQGDLLAKREELKQKLYKSGYFEESHKLDLPQYPSKIAIVTGLNSAAAKDIVFNINRRFPISEVIPFYSLVQGIDAPKDLIKQIKNADESDVDLIIIARGGGSIEDLSAFDDEDLIKTIYDCKTPCISAVGHEINKTFCDFVCDAYASTPTGAAELAVPDFEEIIENLKQNKFLLNSLFSSKINDYKSKISNIKANKYLNNVSANYDKFLSKIENKKIFLDSFIEKYLKNIENNLGKSSSLLEAYNPNNILKKGYSIVSNQNSSVIIDSNQVNIGEKLNLKFYNGSIEVEVKEK